MTPVPAAPGDSQGPRRIQSYLDFVALVLSAGALAVSAAGYLVADRSMLVSSAVRTRSTRSRWSSRSSSR